MVFVFILQFSWGFPKDFHQNLQNQKKKVKNTSYIFYQSCVIFYPILTRLP